MSDKEEAWVSRAHTGEYVIGARHGINAASVRLTRAEFASFVRQAVTVLARGE